MAMTGCSLVLAACGSAYSGSTLAQQVTSWAKSTGFSAEVSTVQSDIRLVDSLSAGSQAAEIKTACAVLVQDTLIANQNLPSPDETLTDLLSTAYSEAGVAGKDCLSGAGHENDLQSRSATERVTARRDLIKA